MLPEYSVDGFDNCIEDDDDDDDEDYVDDGVFDSRLVCSVFCIPSYIFFCCDVVKPLDLKLGSHKQYRTISQGL